MSHYIEALKTAEKECEEWICCNPNDELRPIGTIYSKISKPPENSTECWPSKYTYKVIAHSEMFSYRMGKKAYYKQIELIECIDIETVEG